MSTFVVLTVTGDVAGDESNSSTYEAEDFASLLVELEEDYGECMDEVNVRKEADGHWAVWDDDQMHYITQVD